MLIPWYIFAIGSALILSFSRLIEKKVLYSEHALEFSTSTSIFRIIFLLFFVPFIDFSVLTVKSILIIYIVSVVGTFAFFYRSKATRHMGISDVEPLFNLQPILLLILGYFFLGENPNINQVFGVLLLVCGAYFLEVDGKSRNLMSPIKKFLNSRYIHYVVFAVIGFSFTALFDKIIITKVTMGNIFSYSVVFYIFIGLNFIFLDVFRFGWKDVVFSIKTKPFYTILSMMFHTISIFFYLTCLAIPGVMVSLVIPIRRGSSFFTTIIGGNIFHEGRILQKSMASLIMILGACLIIVFS